MAQNWCRWLRNVNRALRVGHCKRLMDESLSLVVDTFDDVVFSDECSAQLHQNGKVTFRKIGWPRKFFQRPKHPGKIHVLGAISRRGASDFLTFAGIMTSEFYCHGILEEMLKPFLDDVFPDHHRFMHDNDPKHTSKVSQACMARNGIVCGGLQPSHQI